VSVRTRVDSAAHRARGTLGDQRGIREQIPENLVKAKILEEEKRYVEEKLARTREQVQDLVITAKVDGTLSSRAWMICRPIRASRRRAGPRGI